MKVISRKQLDTTKESVHHSEQWQSPQVIYINRKLPVITLSLERAMKKSLMILAQGKGVCWFFLIICMRLLVISAGSIGNPPDVDRLSNQFSHLSYNHGYTELYGGQNIQLTNNGSIINISLNKTSGSGFVSQNQFYYGFFSAAIKLPTGYTSGVAVTFYMSNGNLFPQNHDEIDFELLGHETKKQWMLQTNIYGNGSVSTGREEKFYLWFDPTEAFHDYSIIWNRHHIVFLVDDVPVREVLNTPAFSHVYPSKPMTAYATIWDASDWATHGGKYPVNYKYAPFVASYRDMVMDGCIANSTKPVQSCSRQSLSNLDPVGGEQFVKLSSQQMAAMDWVRKKLMLYSYCRDTKRYKVMPPECSTK